MMAFIGVRISWLMVAKNSLFARLDASATCQASRSLSACLRSVMSRAIPTVPITRPSESLQRRLDRLDPARAAVAAPVKLFDPLAPA
jgi:hypothetical protein